MIRRVCSAVLLGLALPANADYSWELAGLFDNEERNGYNGVRFEDFESDLVSLSATHYFTPVEEGGGPLALAQFFDPRTHLSVAAEDQTTNRFSENQSEEQVTGYSVRGQYLFPESKWYAGGRYARDEGERRFSNFTLSGTVMGETSSTVEDYGLFAGKYFGTGATRLELSLEQSTTQSENSSSLCPFNGGPCSPRGSFTSESTFDTSRLSIMHVRRLRSAAFALLGEYNETPRTYFVGAELYPVPTIGVRLGYERLDAPLSEDSTVSIGASWFVSRNVGLELTLSHGDTDRASFFVDLASTNRAALRVIGRW